MELCDLDRALPASSAAWTSYLDRVYRSVRPPSLQGALQTICASSADRVASAFGLHCRLIFALFGSVAMHDTWRLEKCIVRLDVSPDDWLSTARAS